VEEAGRRAALKREEHGAASQFLHTRVRAGDLLEAAAPRGTFTHDRSPPIRPRLDQVADLVDQPQSALAGGRDRVERLAFDRPAGTGRGGAS